MGRGQDRDRAFSEDIDRVLAGQPAGADFDSDVEYRDSLNFARKITNAAPRLDPEFRTALKARLMRLAEAPAEQLPRRSSFWDFIRQPVWQAMTAVFILVTAGVILWASGVFSPASTPPIVTPTTTIPAGTILSIGADTDKAVYSSGEEVKIDVRLKNVSSQPFKLAQYPPILSLMDNTTNRPVYTFTAGQGSVTLDPGQETVFTLSWRQQDASGSTVSPGRYYIELEDLDSQGKPVQLKLASPVFFDIKMAY